MHERKRELLKETEELVCGDRHEDYGDATTNHTRIAGAWNWWIANRRWAGNPLTAYDVAMMMSLVKFARCQQRPHHDSHVDIAGYAAVAEEIYEKIMEVDNGGTSEPTSSHEGAE